MFLTNLVIIRLLILAFLCFLLALSWAPFLIRTLKKYKMGKSIRTVESAPIMSELHAGKSGIPTMGGVLIWLTVIVVAFFFWVSCKAPFSNPACSWNFISRGQTILPMGALIAAAFVGLLDDYLNIKRIGPKGGGLRVRHRLISYTLIAVTCAWWFYSKLGWDVMHIPFYGNFVLGWLYIPLFTFVIVATSNSVNLTDGLDGLAGGPLMAAFTAYAVIAFSQGKFDLAIFASCIVGALMAFLWFNVPPASLFMGDTGAMSLGTALGILAMLTNQPFLLPIIGLPFVLESLSVILQVGSKKIRGKKIFHSAPVHHHLEKIGWKESQIVFRVWMISLLSAGCGVILALVDRV